MRNYHFFSGWWLLVSLILKVYASCQSSDKDRADLVICLKKISNLLRSLAPLWYSMDSLPFPIPLWGRRKAERLKSERNWWPQSAGAMSVPQRSTCGGAWRATCSSPEATEAFSQLGMWWVRGWGCVSLAGWLGGMLCHQPHILDANGARLVMKGAEIHYFWSHT